MAPTIPLAKPRPKRTAELLWETLAVIFGLIGAVTYILGCIFGLLRIEGMLLIAVSYAYLYAGILLVIAGLMVLVDPKALRALRALSPKALRTIVKEAIEKYME